VSGHWSLRPVLAELEDIIGTKLLAADLAAEVASRRAEIVHLNTEAGKPHNQVNGKTSLASAVLFMYFPVGSLTSLMRV
jgi:hypothetical protein